MKPDISDSKICAFFIVHHCFFCTYSLQTVFAAYPLKEIWKLYVPVIKETSSQNCSLQFSLYLPTWIFFLYTWSSELELDWAGGKLCLCFVNPQRAILRGRGSWERGPQPGFPLCAAGAGHVQPGVPVEWGRAFISFRNGHPRLNTYLSPLNRKTLKSRLQDFEYSRKIQNHKTALLEPNPAFTPVEDWKESSALGERDLLWKQRSRSTSWGRRNDKTQPSWWRVRNKGSKFSERQIRRLDR